MSYRALATMTLAGCCALGPSASAGGPPWWPALETRAGNAITRPWLANPTEAELAIDWGSELILLTDQILIGTRVRGDESQSGPVSVWAAPVWAAPDEDGAPTLGWHRVQDLWPLPQGAESDARAFGTSLAGNDEWIFVGAPAATVDGHAAAGAVHAFHRSSNGAWQGYGVLRASDPLANERFGQSIDFDGSTLLVGVPGRGEAGGADRFQVADKIADPLTFTAPIGLGADVSLGASVAIDGDRFALGDAGASLIPLLAPGLVVIFAAPSPSEPLVHIEQVLVQPSFEHAARFGERLVFDAGRLAVTSPGESNNGVPEAGAVRIYERDGFAWGPTHTMRGDRPFARLDRCAFAGELLAIGAAGWQGEGGPATGRVWLLHLSKGGEDMVATVTSGAGGSLPSTEIGAAIALGGGYVAWRESQQFAGGAETFETVRVLRLDGALSDCDADGSSDLAEVLAGAGDCDGDGAPDDCGAATDCDGNRVPDACDVAWVPAWGLSDPIDDVWWGALGHGPFDPPTAMFVVCGLSVPDGSDGVLRGVTADWLALEDHPQPCAIAVYLDPNQDGDPGDAVLKFVHGVTPAIGPGLEHVETSPVSLGPAGTRYFLAAALARYPGTATSMFIAQYAWSSSQPSVTHGVWTTPEAIDFEHPAQTPEFDQFPVNLALAGLFRSPSDLDGDLIPDACSCPADLDQDGDVGPSDLATLLGAWATSAADLDDDGTTGPSDLALLLGAWGGC